MLDEPRLLAPHPWLTRRPVSVADHHRMGEAGILGRDEHVELIEGARIATSPIGSYHNGMYRNLIIRSCMRLSIRPWSRCRVRSGLVS